MTRVYQSGISYGSQGKEINEARRGIEIISKFQRESVSNDIIVGEYIFVSCLVLLILFSSF